MHRLRRGGRGRASSSPSSDELRLHVVGLGRRRRAPQDIRLRRQPKRRTQSRSPPQYALTRVLITSPLDPHWPSSEARLSAWRGADAAFTGERRKASSSAVTLNDPVRITGARPERPEFARPASARQADHHAAPAGAGKQTPPCPQDAAAATGRRNGASKISSAPAISNRLERSPTAGVDRFYWARGFDAQCRTSRGVARLANSNGASRRLVFLRT